MSTTLFSLAAAIVPAFTAPSLDVVYIGIRIHKQHVNNADCGPAPYDYRVEVLATGLTGGSVSIPGLGTVPLEFDGIDPGTGYEEWEAEAKDCTLAAPPIGTYSFTFQSPIGPDHIALDYTLSTLPFAEITSPKHQDTGVALLPTFNWNAVSAPGTTLLVAYGELDAEDALAEVYLDPTCTCWLAPVEAAAGVEHGFEIQVIDSVESMQTTAGGDFLLYDQSFESENIVTFTTASTGIVPSNGRALVIGNTDYACPSVCFEDEGIGINAARAACALEMAGFEVTKLTNLTAAQIKQEIAAGIPAGPSKPYVVYFSGHGFASAGPPEPSCHGDIVGSQLAGVDCSGVSPADFADALAGAEERTLAIIESCGSGTFAMAALCNAGRLSFLTSTTCVGGSSCASHADPLVKGLFTWHFSNCALYSGGFQSVYDIHTCLFGGYDQTVPADHFYNGGMPGLAIGLNVSLAGSPALVPFGGGDAQQTLTISSCPLYGGDLYFVLGSASGTQPGIALPKGVLLPLVQDQYFLMTLGMPNLGPFGKTFGSLAPNGDAQATITAPASLSSALIGVSLHHAYVVIEPGLFIPFASNSTPLTFVP